MSRIHEAAFKGDLDLVKLLIHQGIKINEKDPQSGCTALHVAVQKDHLDIFKTLISNGADIEAKTIDGWTPLHYAADMGHLNVLNTLIINGVDIEARTIEGSTALLLAAQKDHLDIVKTLISNGADTEARPIEGWTLLHYAANEGHLDVLETLIINGADIEARTIEGLTPLYVAAQEDHLDALKTLIINGAEVDAKTEIGATALHVAAEKDHLDALKTLIINGAEVDAKTEIGHTGHTALHVAAHKGHLDVLKTLIINGADTDATTNQGATAAGLASQFGHTDIVKFLVNRMQDSGKLSGKGSSRSNELASNLLMPAAKEGRMATVQELITNLGADPNHRNRSSGLTSEDMAHLKGQSDVAWLLNKSTQGRNRPSGIRPEWEACKSNYGIDSIKEMQSGKDTTHFHDTNLNAGVFDLHYQDDEGMTHLHTAVKKNQLEVISLLLERGALATAVTHDGVTPHDLASKEGSREEAADKIKEHLKKFTKNELKSASEKSHYYSVLLSLILECVSLSSRHKDDDAKAEQERQKVLKKASWLLSLGVPLEPPGNYYTHALHLAITSNCKSILTLLLAAGAPLYATQNGLGPVEVAWLTPDVTTWISVAVTRIRRTHIP